MATIELDSGVWYGDRRLELPVPADWEVNMLWPETPAPLSQAGLAARLEHPAGQVPITELCRGKSRPLIIIDDMNRPTPLAGVMPLILEQIRQAGIAPENVTLLMATGTHGPPPPEDWVKKVGPQAAACRQIVHDCFKDTVKIGKTSGGTPVYANKAVLESDVVIGVSGIYPNSTSGFGGGSKLALGALGIRSIYHLHIHHPDIGWGNPGIVIPFRRELDEIAAMIGMEMMVSLIIDAKRQIIQLYCGDQKAFFPEAVDFYTGVFSAPGPGDADVILSNAYPNDISFTFAEKKGIAPLKKAKPGASRIAIAACDEGMGMHHIWPVGNAPRFHRLTYIYRVLSVLSLKEMIEKVAGVVSRKVFSRLRGTQSASPHTPAPKVALNPAWFYKTGDPQGELPESYDGMTITSDWQVILDAVEKEQSGRGKLKVVVYPCAFLQILGE